MVHEKNVLLLSPALGVEKSELAIPETRLREAKDPGLVLLSNGGFFEFTGTWQFGRVCTTSTQTKRTLCIPQIGPSGNSPWASKFPFSLIVGWPSWRKRTATCQRFNFNPRQRRGRFLCKPERPSLINDRRYTTNPRALVCKASNPFVVFMMSLHEKHTIPVLVPAGHDSESLVTSVEAESGTTGEVRRVALALAEGTLGVNVDIERPG